MAGAEGLDRLGELLQDPQVVEQLRQAAAGLLGGAQGNAPAQAAPAAQPEGGGLASLLSQGGAAGLASLLGGGAPQPAADPGMVQMVARLAPILARAQQDDDATRFLYALRPLLGESRQKKLDEAVKMMKLLRILPLLKGSGALESLL